MCGHESKNGRSGSQNSGSRRNNDPEDNIHNNQKKNALFEKTEVRSRKGNGSFLKTFIRGNRTALAQENDLGTGLGPDSEHADDQCESTNQACHEYVLRIEDHLIY